MRILHVIPGLTRERGGPTTVLQALVRHQAEAGHRVAVVTTDQGLRRGEHEVQLHRSAAFTRVPVLGPDRLAYAPRFRAAVREQLRSCDVVHVHSIFTYPVHVACREALAGRVPLVFRPCGQLHSYSLRRSARAKLIYLKCWGALIRRACTAWHYTSKQEAAGSWPGDGSRQFVVPNGIEPEEFAVDRAQARRRVGNRWPALRDRPFVLFLGRLHPKKRLDLLVQAFLEGAPGECRLVVAGPDECGIWQPLARQWLGASARADRVVRLGTVQGGDKADLLAAARLFALPSEHENFGIAALEALAAGTPVLLSPGVDLGGELTKADWGEQIPLDVGQWRERFGVALAAPENHAAEVGRQRTAESFSWARIGKVLEEHYAEVARSACADPSR